MSSYELQMTNAPFNRRLLGGNMWDLNGLAKPYSKSADWLIKTWTTMSIEQLKERFKTFAIRTATLISQLPKTNLNNVYSYQLIRCSSSSAANYRAACRGKSTADFINKLKIVEEEIDVSAFFLELLQHFNPPLKQDFEREIKESKGLLAIIVQSIKTTRLRQK